MTPEIGLFTRPFYFVRHGETESNASRLVAGSLDVDLTALGREQARTAGELLRREPITGIYSSPLKRARHTADAIAEALALPVVVIGDIAERNWGELEGKPRGTRVAGVTPLGAETDADFANRVLAGLRRIDTELPLVVAHSGVFRVLCRTLAIVYAETPVANALPLRFVPAGRRAWRIESVGDPAA